MKRLRNTLYVTTPDAYLSLDGENIVLSVKKEERGRRPLHLLDSIIVFGHLGVSPALLGKCSEYLKSPPSWRRGLKYNRNNSGRTAGQVASLVEAWIEIS